MCLGFFILPGTLSTLRYRSDRGFEGTLGIDAVLEGIRP